MGFFLFGKKRRSTRKKASPKKPPAKILRMCKKLKIKCTVKRGNKRVYRKTSILKKLISRKKALKIRRKTRRKTRKVRRVSRRSVGFGRGPNHEAMGRVYAGLPIVTCPSKNDTLIYNNLAYAGTPQNIAIGCVDISGKTSFPVLRAVPNFGASRKVRRVSRRSVGFGRGPNHEVLGRLNAGLPIVSCPSKNSMLMYNNLGYNSSSGNIAAGCVDMNSGKISLPKVSAAPNFGARRKVRRASRRSVGFGVI
jgi:hypothetical protein